MKVNYNVLGYGHLALNQPYKATFSAVADCCEIRQTALISAGLLHQGSTLPIASDGHLIDCGGIVPWREKVRFTGHITRNVTFRLEL